MAILIDGHNLIPYIAGISLAAPDDEDQLIRVLQEYCRVRRKTIEVFFDGAPAGQAGEQRFGQVQAHFVRSGVTADEAMMFRLKQMGKRAKNTTVVSSDRQVQQAARAVHATVISSKDFAADWQRVTEEEPELDPRNRLLTKEETEIWEQFFKRGRPPSEDDN